MKKIVKILLTVVIVAGLVTAAGFVMMNNKKKNDEKTAVVAQTNSAVAVRVSKVEKIPLNLDFTANGKFAPGQELNFSAETAGRVISVLVDEGSVVRKGQTLAVIKTENLSVDVQTAKDAYQTALKDKQRYENAFKTGGVTQQQVDQAELALINAEAKVKQANIRVADANIRASINGIVNKRMIEPGSVLAAGTQLFEIVDVSTLTLDVAVTEAQVASLKVGDAVAVKVSVLPGQEFKGKVKFIAPKADASLNFPVKIEIANNNAKSLKAGMYGMAQFSFPQQQPVILIPRGAFVGSVSNNQVFVADANNKVQLRTVISGRIAGEQVEVVSGLQEGEQVVVSGQINLADGSTIAIIK